MTLYGFASLVLLAAFRECGMCRGHGRIGTRKFTELGSNVTHVGPMVWHRCPFCEGSTFTPAGAADFWEGGAEWVDDLP